MIINYDKILRFYCILDRSCNMNCIYCIQGQQDRGKYQCKFTSFPSPQQVASYYPANNREYEVIFYGGEAFLYFDYMIEIAREIRHRNPNAKFAVTTNGTLLTLERAKILNELGFRVNISHDGYAYEFTRRRKDFLKENPDPVLALDNFVFISTISRLNWDYYYIWEYFENFFIKHGVKRRKVNMMFLKDSGGFTPAELFIYKDKKFENMLDRVFGNLKTQLLTRQYDTYEFMCYENMYGRILKDMVYSKNISLCMFFDVAMAIDVFGNIYDCHNAINPYGNIRDKVLKDFTNPYLLKEPCKSCQINNICSGGCIKASADKRKYICYYMRNEIGRLVHTLNECVLEKRRCLHDKM